MLVVDDDEDIRSSVTDLLQGAGFAVETAKDGEDALEQLMTTTNRPNLILLDLKMPRMNGWNFRLQLERSPLLSGIPVVLLSGSRSLEAQALALNVNGHLRKPVESEQLFGVVRRYCVLSPETGVCLPPK